MKLSTKKIDILSAYVVYSPWFLQSDSANKKKRKKKKINNHFKVKMVMIYLRQYTLFFAFYFFANARSN